MGTLLCLESHFWLRRCRPGPARETVNHTYRGSKHAKNTGQGMPENKSASCFVVIPKDGNLTIKFARAYGVPC